MSKQYKDYNNLGIAYTIFVCAITIIQYIFKYLITNNIIPDNSNIINLLGNSTTYILGLLILVPLVYIPSKQNKPLDKHKTKFSEFLKYFVIAYFIMVASNIIGLIITNVITLIKGVPVSNPLLEVLNELDISVTFILAVVLAPIMEEIFFRKLIIDRLYIHGKWVSIFISGLMFGLFHGNLNQFVYAFMLGMFLAYIYIKKGSIKVCILLHALINSMSFIIMLIMNNIDIDLINSIELDINNIMSYISISDIISFIFLLLYELFMVVIIILGLIFFILNYKKIRNDIREYKVNDTISIKNVLLTKGILLFNMVHIIIIIKQLFE